MRSLLIAHLAVLVSCLQAIDVSAQITDITFASQDGTQISGTHSRPVDCNNCPMVLIIGDESDRDGTIEGGEQLFGDCFYPQVDEPIKPFEQLSQYMLTRNVQVIRYDSRITDSSIDTDLATYSYESVMEDAKAAASYAKSLGDENMPFYVLTHNDGIIAGAEVANEYDAISLVAISPKLSRADSTAGDFLLAHFDECENQRQLGLIFRNITLQQLDSVYNGFITEGPLATDETAFLYNQYPTYWVSKIDASLALENELNSFEGRFMALYGTRDATVVASDIDRLDESTTLPAEEFEIYEPNNATNIITDPNNPQIIVPVARRIVDFMLGPLSVEELPSDMISDRGDSFEIKDTNNGIELSIIDVSGRLLNRSNGRLIEKPSHNGFYILIVKSGDKVYSKKFTVSM
jgi:hypothetical protein